MLESFTNQTRIQTIPSARDWSHLDVKVGHVGKKSTLDYKIFLTVEGVHEENLVILKIKKSYATYGV